MQIKLGNRDYEVVIGLAALNYLDQIYPIQVNGFEIGLGLNKFYLDLKLKNITAIAKFIKAGTITEPQKPSNAEIEEFIGSMTEKQLNDFFKEIDEELGKFPVTKVKWKELTREIDKLIEEAQRQQLQA